MHIIINVQTEMIKALVLWLFGLMVLFIHMN